MGKVSLGYFDPKMFYENVERMTSNIGSRLIDEARNGDEPLLSRAIVVDGRDTGATYMMCDRPLPMRLAEKSPNDGSFLFVLRTGGRPALLTVSDDAGGPQALGACVMRQGVRVGHPFGIGAMELSAGAAIHLNMRTTWIGTVGLPVPHLTVDNRDIVQHPTLLMVRVDGYDAANIETAVRVAAQAVIDDKWWWLNPMGLIGL